MEQTVTDGILPASRRFGSHNFFNFFSKKHSFFVKKFRPRKRVYRRDFFLTWLELMKLYETFLHSIHNIRALPSNGEQN